MNDDADETPVTATPEEGHPETLETDLDFLDILEQTSVATDTLLASWYEEVRSLGVSQCDDYVPQGDEVAFYIEQSVLARVCRVCPSSPKKNPIILLRVSSDGLTAISGSSAVRGTVAGEILAFKPSSPTSPLRFNCNFNELRAVLYGSEGAIRFVYVPGASTIQLTSGGFTRPLALLSQRTLPALIDEHLPVDRASSVSVPAAKVEWALRYLSRFAQLHDLATDRVIEIRDGCLSAGSALRSAAARVYAKKLAGLTFSIGHTEVPFILPLLEEMRDGNVSISFSGQYVIFTSERTEVVVAKAGVSVSDAVRDRLNRQIDKSDKLVMSRSDLITCLPRISFEPPPKFGSTLNLNDAQVRISAIDERAFMFVTSTKDGDQSQFKLIGELRKHDPHAPLFDFRTSLALLAHALPTTTAPYVFIDSWQSDLAWIDDEHDGEPVRTVLPVFKTPAVRTRPQPARSQIAKEEIVDDNR
jgi:hypothetical protein